MLTQIFKMSEFKKDFEKWREFQYHADPYLRCSVDFLGKKIEDISEEAVLLSIIRTGKVSLRKE